jgi:hypothetical protein
LSETPACTDIVRAIHSEELSLMSWTWYSRVPSLSNPADGPSRLDFDEAVSKFHARIYDVRAPSSLLNAVWLEYMHGLHAV